LAAVYDSRSFVTFQITAQSIHVTATSNGVFPVESSLHLIFRCIYNACKY